MKKYALIISLASILLMSNFAYAHVVVRPNTVNVAAFQTFTVGVPNEREVGVTGVRLVIPEGMKHVSPNVKPGWEVDVEEVDGVVTEIRWTGGLIPVGFREEFLFSAQAPANAGALQWDAYQTYEDGSVVSWDASDDQQPVKEDGSPDFSEVGPYSQTEVVDDFETGADSESHDATPANTPDPLSIAAIIIAGVALGMQFFKKS